MLLSPIPRHSVSREPVSRMQLVFDEDEDDVAQESEGTAVGGAHAQTSGGTEARPGDAPHKPAENSGPPDAGWGLGESPCVHWHSDGTDLFQSRLGFIKCHTGR